MAEFSVSTLFSGKWSEFDMKNIKKEENVFCPGVYLIAYSDVNLEGGGINSKDVFYVGMANSKRGVFQRLRQFYQGITINRSHSGGKRFFREYAGGVSYGVLNNRKKFYFSFLSIPCEVLKSERLGDDLRIMGEVAKLEYDVLAYIKDKTDKEPELNKK